LSTIPHAQQVFAEDFDLTETPIGLNTYVVIATQHKNDHRWLEIALQGDAAYVALIASQHRAKLVLDYLAAEGVPPAKLPKIFAPVGLDLGAATPEEIALSIVSQIVALRRGGTSQPLHRKDAIENHGARNSSDPVITRCDAPSAD
jgi:xanthine dehydrogenase accessory factor